MPNEIIATEHSLQTIYTCIYMHHVYLCVQYLCYPSSLLIVSQSIYSKPYKLTFAKNRALLVYPPTNPTFFPPDAPHPHARTHARAPTSTHLQFGLSRMKDPQYYMGKNLPAHSHIYIHMHIHINIHIQIHKHIAHAQIHI